MSAVSLFNTENPASLEVNWGDLGLIKAPNPGLLSQLTSFTQKYKKYTGKSRTNVT
jgi:hypothetical protein